MNANLIQKKVVLRKAKSQLELTLAAVCCTHSLRRTQRLRLCSAGKSQEPLQSLRLTVSQDIAGDTQNLRRLGACYTAASSVQELVMNTTSSLALKARVTMVLSLFITSSEQHIL